MSTGEFKLKSLRVKATHGGRLGIEENTARHNGTTQHFAYLFPTILVAAATRIVRR
jgi:hypothetical protein